MLRTEPSFSVYNSVDGIEDEGKQREDLLTEEGLKLERIVTIRERIVAIDSGEFSFGKKSMALIEEGREGEEEGFNGIRKLDIEEEEGFNGTRKLGIKEEEGFDGIRKLGIEEDQEEVEPASPPMYLATGLGIEIDGNGFIGGNVDLNPTNIDESGNLEDYYKRMVDEYPCHPLFLRNYAQLLQFKGDRHGAEDYYHRATLACPEDGEMLSNYAKLVWELHHDQSKALHYFECAARAAPQDSNVLAAYARFLWEIDDDEEEESSERIEQFQIEEENPNKIDNSGPKEETEHLEAGLKNDLTDISATDASKDSNLEENYKRMLEEDPCNPLVLRNYAQFLCQSKGDLQGAEVYYSSAIQADPGDGETISQYAKLVWDLHHDHDKASSYFDKAVQATPGDSYVLAAYAAFLWETEEDEGEDSARQDQCPASSSS